MWAGVVTTFHAVAIAGEDAAVTQNVTMVTLTEGNGAGKGTNLAASRVRLVFGVKVGSKM